MPSAKRASTPTLEDTLRKYSSRSENEAEQAEEREWQRKNVPPGVRLDKRELPLHDMKIPPPQLLRPKSPQQKLQAMGISLNEHSSSGSGSSSSGSGNNGTKSAQAVAISKEDAIPAAAAAVIPSFLSSSPSSSSSSSSSSVSSSTHRSYTAAEITAASAALTEVRDTLRRALSAFPWDIKNMNNVSVSAKEYWHDLSAIRKHTIKQRVIDRYNGACEHALLKASQHQEKAIVLQIFAPDINWARSTARAAVDSTLNGGPLNIPSILKDILRESMEQDKVLEVDAEKETLRREERLWRQGESSSQSPSRSPSRNSKQQQEFQLTGKAQSGGSSSSASSTGSAGAEQATKATAQRFATYSKDDQGEKKGGEDGGEGRRTSRVDTNGNRSSSSTLDHSGSSQKNTKNSGSSAISTSEEAVAAWNARPADTEWSTFRRQQQQQQQQQQSSLTSSSNNKPPIATTSKLTGSSPSSQQLQSANNPPTFWVRSGGPRGTGEGSLNNGKNAGRPINDVQPMRLIWAAERGIINTVHELKQVMDAALETNELGMLDPCAASLVATIGSKETADAYVLSALHNRWLRAPVSSSSSSSTSNNNNNNNNNNYNNNNNNNEGSSGSSNATVPLLDSLSSSIRVRSAGHSRTTENRGEEYGESHDSHVPSRNSASTSSSAASTATTTTTIRNALSTAPAGKPVSLANFSGRIAARQLHSYLNDRADYVDKILTEIGPSSTSSSSLVLAVEDGEERRTNRIADNVVAREQQSDYNAALSDAITTRVRTMHQQIALPIGARLAATEIVPGVISRISQPRLGVVSVTLDNSSAGNTANDSGAHVLQYNMEGGGGLQYRGGTVAAIPFMPSQPRSDAVMLHDAESEAGAASSSGTHSNNDTSQQPDSARLQRPVSSRRASIVNSARRLSIFGRRRGSAFGSDSMHVVDVAELAEFTSLASRQRNLVSRNQRAESASSTNPPATKSAAAAKAAAETTTTTTSSSTPLTYITNVIPAPLYRNPSVAVTLAAIEAPMPSVDHIDIHTHTRIAAKEAGILRPTTPTTLAESIFRRENADPMGKLLQEAGNGDISSATSKTTAAGGGGGGGGGTIKQNSTHKTVKDKILATAQASPWWHGQGWGGVDQQYQQPPATSSAALVGPVAAMYLYQNAGVRDANDLVLHRTLGSRPGTKGGGTRGAAASNIQNQSVAAVSDGSSTLLLSTSGDQSPQRKYNARETLQAMAMSSPTYNSSRQGATTTTAGLVGGSLYNHQQHPQQQQQQQQNDQYQLLLLDEGGNNSISNTANMSMTLSAGPSFDIAFAESQALQHAKDALRAPGFSIQNAITKRTLLSSTSAAAAAAAAAAGNANANKSLPSPSTMDSIMSLHGRMSTSLGSSSSISSSGSSSVVAAESLAAVSSVLLASQTQLPTSPGTRARVLGAASAARPLPFKLSPIATRPPISMKKKSMFASMYE